MGLYGALVVRPNTTTCPPVAGTNCAYGASTRYDSGREYLLLLSEIDPVLHHAVETGGMYDLNARRPRHFIVNGREFPDSIQDNGTGLQPNQPYGALVRLQPNTAGNTQPALIRMVNAGLLNHPFHPHGNHTEIAQDGRAVPRTEHFAETIGSGQTLDYLIRWDDVDQWTPGNPLPVAQPNYRNLTFKDGNTFYSGSPYLGYKGTLPAGTVSQNVCGEWYFPWHSHALNEFSNFDEGFGGMATLLRVDPPGGCFGSPTATAIIGGTLKGGTFAALAAADNSYYQVNPKTTTTTASRTAGQTTIPVASAAGFPASGSYYVRIGSEVLQVTGGQGTTTWTVLRGQLGTTAASHPSGATVTALANDWYATFTGLPAGAANLKGPTRARTASSRRAPPVWPSPGPPRSRRSGSATGRPRGRPAAPAARPPDGSPCRRHRRIRNRWVRTRSARRGRCPARAAPTSAPGRTRERSASSCTPSGGRERRLRRSRPGATS
jgi:hypothetical protein